TQLATSAITNASGSEFIFEVNSSNELRLYKNGVLVLGPVTEAAHSSATKWGIRSNSDTTVRFDNFSFRTLPQSWTDSLIYYYQLEETDAASRQDSWGTHHLTYTGWENANSH